jgi:hypothetical protein
VKTNSNTGTKTMMSLRAIIAVNQEIAAEAAQERLVPYVPFNLDEIDFWPPIPFPNLGYFEPDGWEKTDQSWFVDKTGVGRSKEPAMTLDQFKRAIREYVRKNPGHGFAITEEGEFQATISAFRPIS